MILTSHDGGRTYRRATHVHVDDAGHALLRVALEDTRVGGAVVRDGVAVEHTTAPTGETSERVEAIEP